MFSFIHSLSLSFIPFSSLPSDFSLRLKIHDRSSHFAVHNRPNRSQTPPPKHVTMYATKRKLHNLLQAATGSSSSSSSGGGGTAGGSGKGHRHTGSTDSTKSKLATVFRSKSTVHLSAKAVAERAAIAEVTGKSDVTEGRRPTTAGAVERRGTPIGANVPVDVDAHTSREATDIAPPRSPPSTVPDPKKRRTIHLPTVTSDVSHTYESWSIRTTNPSATQTTAFSLSEKPTPAYAPWDRPQFLSRLRTFRFVDKWSAKPALVNEVIWAKRGWICIEKNRVRCTVCSREVLVKIDADDDGFVAEDGVEEDTVMSDVEGLEGERIKREARKRMQREIVDRYRGMVVTEHEDYCLWRRRGCDGE